MLSVEGAGGPCQDWEEPKTQNLRRCLPDPSRQHLLNAGSLGPSLLPPWSQPCMKIRNF